MSKIPIRINPAPAPQEPESSAVEEPAVTEAAPPVADSEAVPATKAEPTRPAQRAEPKDAEFWRERALRLQAEMDNFRKRQRRLAEERVLADKERLLRSLLEVADDLERALIASTAEAENLRQGVQVTRQRLMRLLKQEGVEPITSEGRPFDPRWHEAVGTVPRPGVEPGTVVEVMQEGYRLKDRLLRAARVIIAA